MAVTIHVHPLARMTWRPLDQFVPDTARELAGLFTAEEGNGHPPKLYGLQFTTPEGEQHIFAFTDDARQALVQKMTGGLVVPSG